MAVSASAPYFRSVFINCPFDADYRLLFNAIAFAVADCGFIPRCALEAEDSGDIRILKILDIIEQCGYGIHDISRTESTPSAKRDGTTELLPRFNMPLELGLFIGAQRFGHGQQKRKNYLVFDVEPHRYQRFISDLAGQDIKAHHWPGMAATAEARDRAVSQLILAIRNWLTTKIDGDLLPGGNRLTARFGQFQAELPDMATEFGQQVMDLSFYDLLALIAGWQKANPHS
ncbi:hypothetical protein [Hymenobacter ruricola]|uniref:DUF4062 domain-containing protein n=1 Tax=Hymenobacter ruricola TaxID=2791023 RepID=A0ABS0I5S7_9BACT|nr:hypothetical protein [Hymenobacter ruricola]MBF9222324.1 hypothetical protein [Hymenobacter ruricola]